MEARDAPDVQSLEAPDFRPRLRRWIEWADERIGHPAHGYWLTRFALLRALGFIYFIAFLSATQQLVPLIGAHGITPAGDYLARLSAAGHGAADVPSLFWITSSDTALLVVAWLGAALSLAVLCGVTNAPVMAALWILYTSIVNVGQVWYGYGWELMVLEAGFLAIFLCPLGSLRPLPHESPPSRVVMWLYRWMLFRVMFGAGLIKLRGDSCWRDLTCLDYHYETQPVPGPLSWYWHHAPEWVHRAGVVGNHAAELVVPWLIFGPRRVRHIAAAILIGFQVLLILSGNLSFLNWLTIAICLACFDDGAIGRLFPRRVRAMVARLHQGVRQSTAQRLVVLGLAAVIAVLSIEPALNLVFDRPEHEPRLRSLQPGQYLRRLRLGRPRPLPGDHPGHRRPLAGRRPLEELRLALPAGAGRSAALFDHAVPPSPRLADVVRRPVDGPLQPVAGQPGLSALARR